MIRLSTLASAVVGALLLVSCSAPQSVDTSGATGSESAATSGSSAATGTFVYAISGDPTSLNPINVSDRWGLTTTNIVYSPLAHVNADGTTSNDLAESIEPADDGLSVTVKLREGIKWSDGEALDADDVVFTYTTKAKKENGNADALWVGDAPITATKVDDLTVRFDLPAYSAAAVANLAFETYIIPEHVYGEIGDFSGAELDPIAVGSGPYKLTKYERGQYLTFEANEHYYGDAPNIKNLTLQIVANADTVKAGLQTGELDASFVTPQQVPDLEGSPVTVYPYPEGRVAYLGVVTPKVSDVKVRQALFYSLNRDDILKASWLDEDNYAPAYTILPPSNKFATDDVEHYDQDIEKAKQLLSEAGASNVSLTLAYAGNDPAQTTQATLIQQQAGEAGITVELAGIEGAAVYSEIEKGVESAYDLFLGGYIMGPDVDAYGALYRTGSSANYFSYSSEATDDLFAQGAAAKSEDERKDIYADLQKQIASDAVMFPIGDNLKLIAVNDRITGVEDATPVPIYSLANFGKLAEK